CHQAAGAGGVLAGSVADDQRDRNDAAVHGQDVLQAVRQIGADAQPFVLGAFSFGNSGRRCHWYLSLETRWFRSRPHVKDGIVFQANSLGVVPLRTTSAVMSP